MFTWFLTWVGLPSDENWKLFTTVLPPSVTSVQQQDSSGTLSSIGHNVYGFEDKYIEIPSDYVRNIKIVYTTSGLSFSDIKMAIKQLATTYYDNRSEYVKGTIVAELPTNIKSILSKYVYYNELWSKQEI